MKNAFYKDILRTVRKSFKRFVSLVAIMALGLMVFLGITAACDNLFIAADHFYDDQQVFDIRIQSTLGLTVDDEKALESVDGIIAQGVYSETVETVVGDRSLSAEVTTLSTKGLNMPYLISGHLPTGSGEMVVTQKYLDASGKSIGDSVVIEEIADAINEDDTDPDSVDEIEIEIDSETLNFRITEYTITGVVVDPLDIAISADDTASYRSTATTDYFFFIPSEDVDTDVYTSISIKLENASTMDCYSPEYREAIQSFVSIIENNIMYQRQQARYDEVIANAMEKIAIAEASINDKFAENDKLFEDAWTEIRNARKELSDGEYKLVREEEEAYRQFRQARMKIADGRNAITENTQLLSSALAQLQKGESEYNAGLSAYNDLNSQYTAAVNDMNALSQGVNQGIPATLGVMQGLMTKYPTNADWATSASQQEVGAFISASYTVIGVVDGMATLCDEGGAANAAQLLSGITNGVTGLVNSGDFEGAYIQLLSVNASYGLPGTGTPYTLMQSTLTGSAATLQAYKAQLDDAKQQLDDAKTKIETGRYDYDKAVNELSLASIKLTESEKELDVKTIDALKKIAAAWQEISDIKKQLNTGESELTTEEQEYTEKKEIAKQKIDDAYSWLDEIDMTQWYVQDRAVISSYADFEANVGSIGAVARVFPILFLIVAILISLTTMTRMVEEERGFIGTYKALGYSNTKIGSKYIIYALLALVIGSVIGSILGFTVLPKAFILVLESLYFVPGIVMTINVQNAILGALIFMACILLTTAVACRKELKLNPAMIMRPKVPQMGSRIFLERFPFIWNNMKFLNKITARNLFRYKKRLAMTIIGIAGCMGLVVLGFAIRDSANGAVPKQYEKVFRYDLTVVAHDDNTDDMLQFFEDEAVISGYLPVRMESAKLYNEHEESESLQLVVIPDGASLGEYVGMFDLENRLLDIGDDGVYVTLNAAKLIELEAGSPVSLQNLLLDKRSTVVNAVVENYLGNFVYISQAHYEALFDEFEPNAVYANLSEEVPDQQDYAENLLEEDFVMLSFSKQTLKEQFESENTVLNSLVFVMTALAALLAFIVLFTLSNTNISERDRELATIKVLGFYDRELYSYINKETLSLTLIGVIAGIPLGYFISSLVFSVLELPSLELAVTIRPTSFIISGIITFIFAIIVNMITNRILRKINMVEALKSVE